MTDVYIAIDAHLHQAIAALEHIDLYNDQYNSAAEEHSYNMPAVFVQFMPVVDWTTNSDGSQYGTLKLQLHVVTTCYSDTANPHRMAPIDKSLAFGHLDIVKDIHVALHGYAPACCTALQRTGYYPDVQHDQVQVTILEYSCQYTDNSTADTIRQETTLITPELAVTHPITPHDSDALPMPTPTQFLLP